MTRLSNRQFPLLRLFAHREPDFCMPLEVARKYDQRPFGSLLCRDWVAYRPGKGFHITAKGREAWKEFQHTGILRQDQTRPLSHYFDAAFYGIPNVRERLQVVRGGRSTAA